MRKGRLDQYFGVPRDNGMVKLFAGSMSPIHW